MELKKNNSSHSEISCNLERNIVKCLTLTGKQIERNTRKKLSTTYHLIMSIFIFVSFCRFHEMFGVN